jgi:hypothetical protein
MKIHPENVDVARVLGYLGADDILYCSPGCAAARGQTEAVPVDRDEPEVLERRGALAAGCPVCRAEYPLDWEEERA